MYRYRQIFRVTDMRVRDEKVGRERYTDVDRRKGRMSDRSNDVKRDGQRDIDRQAASRQICHQTDIQIERENDRQGDRLKDREQINRQIDRQAESPTKNVHVITPERRLGRAHYNNIKVSVQSIIYVKISIEWNCIAVNSAKQIAHTAHAVHMYEE